MKKHILKKAAAVLGVALAALPAMAQHASLVPNKPYSGKTYDYFCTWNIQSFAANYVNASGTGSPEIRSMMVEDYIFGGNNVFKNNTNSLGLKLYDKYKNWAGFFPSLHGDLYLVLDDSWDIPVNQNGRRSGNASQYGGMAPFGTDILNTTRFPSFNKGNATANMKALVDKVEGTGYGWKGLGLWVACNVPDNQNDENYWKARLKELGNAGVSYLKIDWSTDSKPSNTHSRDVNYRKNITDWGQQTAPNIILEHATFQGLGNPRPNVFSNSEVVRTYDVDNNIAEAQTIDRIAEVLKGNYKPYKDGWGIINCEDEPYIAVGLGCAIGIMRHPLAGTLPNGNTDTYFAEFENGKKLKHRLNEVVRAVHWHRIAQPFGIGGDYALSKNADGTDATMSESSNFNKEDVSVRTYNRVSRGIDLPLYTDGDNGAAISFNDDGTTQKADFGDRPFVLASHYPSGATAVAAVNRYKKTGTGNTATTKYYKVGVNVTVAPPKNSEPVGIFGYFNNLTLKFKDGLPTGTIKVWAQDLADDSGTPKDITNLVTVNKNDGSIVVKGTTINDLCKDNHYEYSEVRNTNGLKDVDYTDVSEPGIVLKVEGTGSLIVDGDKLEAESGEQFNRGDNARQYVQLGDNEECSGGQFVKWLAYGNQINFNYKAEKAGKYTLNVYYLSAGGRTLDVYINGKKTTIAADQLPSTGSLNDGAPGLSSIDVDLVKGNNTISLGNRDGQAPNIDCIALKAKALVDDPDGAKAATRYYIKNKGQNKYVKTGGKAKTPDSPTLMDNDNDRTAQYFTKANDGTYTIADPEFYPQGWGLQGRNTIYESNNGGTNTRSWGTTLIPGFKLVDTGDDDDSYYLEYTWGKWTAGNINIEDPSNKTYVVTYGKYDQSTANWNANTLNDVANPQVYGGHIENLSNYGDNAKWYFEPADGGYNDLTTFTQDGKVKVKETYENITLGSSESTYASSNALDFTNVEGLKAYYAKSVNNNLVLMERLTGAVSANTGIFLIGEAGKTYQVPVAASGAAPEGNLLLPAVEYTRVYPTNDTGTHALNGGTKYNLMLNYANGKGYYFIRFSYPSTFGLNRAYLQLDKSYFDATTGAAKQFFISFSDGAATGISNITVPERVGDNAAIYDLQGRRLMGTPAHGVYIKGGKKFVVK